MYTKRITLQRRGLGDGPITSPTQVDVPVKDPDQDVLIGTVGPTRVDCAALPADSPWRGPKGPCPSADTAASTLVTWLKGLLTSSTASTAAEAPAPVPAAPVETESMLPTLALLAAAGGAAYYFYTSKKRSR